MHRLTSIKINNMSYEEEVEDGKANVMVCNHKLT